MGGSTAAQKSQDGYHQRIKRQHLKEMSAASELPSLEMAMESPLKGL